MKLNATKIGRVVATAAICGAMMGVVGCSGGGGGGADAGEALFNEKCANGGDCHDVTTVTDAAGNYNSPEEWADLVARMQVLTTEISDEDAATITDYLANNM